MYPQIATLVFAVGILGLFVLDRDRNSQAAKALWIPVVWLWIFGSRSVSQWLGMAPSLDSPDQYLEGSPLDRLIFTGLIAAGVIVLLRRRQQVGELLRANVPILLFLLYCAASTLWSDYPFVAFKRWVKLLGDVVMVLIVLSDHHPSTAMKRLLTRTAFLLLPLSILLIKYYPDLGRSYNTWTWTPTYTGVTTGKNLLGMICLIFGLGSVWRFLLAFWSSERSRRTAQLIAHGTLVAMVLWLLVTANSATSLVCFILGAGVLAVVTLPALASKPATVHFLFGVMLFLGLVGLLFDADTVLIEGLGRDPTLTGRTIMWSQLLEMAANPIVGTGFESFWLGPRLERIWSKYGRLNEAHNGYLEVFLQLGWIGVSLLILLMVTGYRNIAAACRRDPGTASLRLAYFVIAAVYALTEAAFRATSPIWIAFLLAITVVPKPLRREDGRSPSTRAALSG